MTILVGVRCTDGVVIGSDSIATSSMGPQPTIHLPFDQKIQIFGDAVIVATTGSIGFSQRLSRHVDEAVKAGVFKNFSLGECTKNISKRFLGDIAASNAYYHPQLGLQFGALIAAGLKDGPFLAEFATTDFQPEVKIGNLFFVSMGSGQVLGDPFLAFVSKVLWNNTMPTIDEGKFGVYWVLAHTIKFAPGKVGPPIRLAVLRQIDGKWVAKEQDTQESAQYIAELEQHIGQFVKASIETAQASPVPSPEPKK